MPPLTTAPLTVPDGSQGLKNLNKQTQAILEGSISGRNSQALQALVNSGALNKQRLSDTAAGQRTIDSSALAKLIATPNAAAQLGPEGVAELAMRRLLENAETGASGLEKSTSAGIRPDIKRGTIQSMVLGQHTGGFPFKAAEAALAANRVTDTRKRDKVVIEPGGGSAKESTTRKVESKNTPVAKQKVEEQIGTGDPTVDAQRAMAAAMASGAIPRGSTFKEVDPLDPTNRFIIVLPGGKTRGVKYK